MFRCCHVFGCTPCILDAHQYVWTLPCLHSPNMFGCPLYVWVPPMFGHPYVWLDAPTCLDAPLYVWMPPTVWGIQTWECPNIQEASKHRGAQTYRGLSKHWGIQTYRGCPHIWGYLNIQGPSKHMGHPNIQGAIQTYGGIQMSGTYGHPFNVTKHAFFVLCMYICIQTPSKHTGGCQKYWGHPNIWVVSKHTGGGPYIWGIQIYWVSTHIGASKCTGGIQTCRGCIQTYGVHQNIKGVSKHVGAFKNTGGIQMYGCIWPYSAFRPRIFLCSQQFETYIPTPKYLDFIFTTADYLYPTKIYSVSEPALKLFNKENKRFRLGDLTSKTLTILSLL